MIEMPEVQFAVLGDRGVVHVGGGDAHKFLQGLITSDLDMLDAGGGLFAGLLTPQGKILFDFFITRDQDGYLIDVTADMVAGLIKRLTMYRLRADVTLRDMTDTSKVYGVWGDALASTQLEGHAFSDPRHPDLGQRVIANPIAAAMISSDHAAYHAHRISLGIPEGGKDYPFGDTYPHEALYDGLHGVSFTKGCFIGQEVVSRMEHRKATKKRIVQVQGAETLPATGTEIKAGPITLGQLGSTNQDRGLALIRIDRLKDVARSGDRAHAAGIAVKFSKPSWAPFDLS